jgi:hypothetical protein
MNILQKIEKFAQDNNSKFEISGSVKTRIFYGKVYRKPYKIIASGNNKTLFTYLLNKLVQDKEKCKSFGITFYGYRAVYIDGIYELEIETNFNGYDTICVYK